jgi:hypothetical protein
MSVKTLKQETGLSLYELVSLCKKYAMQEISWDELQTIRQTAKKQQKIINDELSTS